MNAVHKRQNSCDVELDERALLDEAGQGLSRLVRPVAYSATPCSRRSPAAPIDVHVCRVPHQPAALGETTPHSEPVPGWQPLPHLGIIDHENDTASQALACCGVDLALGLISVGEGTAHDVLVTLGVSYDKLRDAARHMPPGVAK